MIETDLEKISTWNLKVIFFDVGDTLYKSEEMKREYPRQLETLLAKDRAISIQEARSIMNKQRKLIEDRTLHVTKVAIMESLGYSRNRVHIAYNQVDPKPFLHEDKELQQVIKSLKSRYKLGIITNLQKEHIKWILIALGISIEDFEYLIGEEDVKEIKPSPEPFLKALYKSNVPANQTVHVSDSITKDLQPAKQVDMHTILVSSTTEKVSHEYESIVDCIVDNIYDIAKLLTK